MTRRRQHDRWHDAWVMILAVATLLVIWVVWEMTEPQTPAPVEPPQATVEPDSRAAAIRAASRDGDRAPVSGAVTTDPSGGPDRTGKKDRAVVGQTLRCIREAESGGDYRAENPVSSASGAWQFIDSTWESVTGLPAPASAYSRKVQDAAALELWAGGAGAGHWVTAGACGA